MRTVCDLNKCTACMACVEKCSHNAITVIDSIMYVNAVIKESKCINCGLCEKVCQVVHPLARREPIYWSQGWTTDEVSRRRSSSGAFAHSLARQMIADGGYVAACKFEKGEFGYALTQNAEELDQFRGSKYVKSDPKSIYFTVEKVLEEGKKALFIGLPCHVSGLKKYLGKEYENLITVDLVCHGSPSPKLLEMFLNQYGISLNLVQNISFRKKDNFRICGSKIGKEKEEFCFTEPGIRDRFSLAFLYGLIYTDNCYQCPYAGIGRVSDITLGDSWGSELDEKDRKRGISLALCQTEKGKFFLERCKLKQFQVDIEKAVEANQQLRKPSHLPPNRDLFFKLLDEGKTFNSAIRKCFPKACARLDLKNFILSISNAGTKIGWKMKKAYNHEPLQKK